MDETERSSFVPVTLIVLATQAPYLFFTPGKPNPEIWPFWGLAAGLLAFLLARPDRLEDAGISTRGLARGLGWLAILVAAWTSGLALGQILGIVHVTEGVDRSAPDLIRPFAARVALVFAVSIFGDELAWRGILQGEAQERWGKWRGLLLVTFASALYRLPLSARMGLIDDVPIGIEILVRELLRALTLGLLFERTRSLWVVGLYAFVVTALPSLLLGNAEEPFEPLFFFTGEGPKFLALCWIGEVLPVAILATLAIRGGSRASSRAESALEAGLPEKI